MNLLHKLLLLTKDRDRAAYLNRLQAANLPDLEIVTTFAADADLVFGEPTLIREILPHLPGLRWVQATWAGVEPLLGADLRRDYILTNARGVFGGLMSEFVFGYLLLHERKILQRLAAQKESRWEPELTGTLHGKTIGLLGVGSIGAHLAGTARHFGMRVRGYTRASETCAFVDRYYHGTDLQAFASRLDVLVNVLPNTPRTRKIVDTGLLAALAEGAIFLNVGRGSAVNEADLIASLKNGHLACAVLDVFEQEPLPAGHPFWKTENLYITSHTSAPSFPEDLADLFIENYLNFIQGSALNYRVDFELGY